MTLTPGERELLKLAAADPDALLLGNRLLLVVVAAVAVLAVATAITLTWRTC